MKQFPLIITLIFLGIFLPPTLAGAASTGNPAPHPIDKPALTFGSQGVLDSLWTESELCGAAAEKKTVSRSSPRSAPSPPPAVVHHTLPPLPAELMNSIRAIIPSENRKIIALTFDLCEGKGEIAGYDAGVVDFLRAAKIKATFLAGGKWMQSHPVRTMQLMADPIFEIGNHSWSHPNFRLITEAAMHDQILRTQAQYEHLWAELGARTQARGLDPAEMNQIPKLPLTFRFPYGTCNETALRVTAEHGLPAIQWNIVTADSVKSQTAAKIAGIILKRAKPGSIVIMHANGKGVHTASALPLCVPPLLSRGYQFVTVSELLAAGKVIAPPSCYEEKPNDNLRYDRPPKKPGQPLRSN